MFKIRNKILLTFLTVIIIPIIIISVFFTLYTRKSLRQIKITELQKSTEIKVEQTLSFIRSAEDDLRTLTNNTTLLNLLDAIKKEDREQINRSKTNLELLFKSFSESKRIYDQVCYINESGREISKTKLLNRVHADIVSSEALQDKSGRNYFKETVKLNEGKIYISELGLNREYGEIESPHKPMLRYAMPVFDKEKQKKGILVLNILADYLLKNFSARRLSERTDSYLLDQDGFYLLHPDRSKQWGGIRDLNTKENIKGDFSKETAGLILSGQHGVTLIDNLFYNYMPIKYDSVDSGRYWICMESMDKSMVYSPVYTFYKNIGVLVFLLTVGVVTVSLVLSRRLTRPLDELVKGAAAVAKGDLDYNINIKSNNEFAFLTFSFNKMVSNLGKSRKNLQDYTNNLEKKVEDKTKVLNEKLRQNEVLVEIGQLLWNEQDVDNTMNCIVNLISKTLKVEFCKILLLDKSKTSLSMVSGVGWKEDILGNATGDVGLHSHADYTLKELKPVVVEDFTNETRFSRSPLMVEHGVVSGLSVPIIVEQHILGVLAVHSAELRRFSKDETDFLRSVGLIVASTIERKRTEKEIASEREYTENLIKNAQDAIVCIDDKGIITIWNKSAEKVFGYSESEIIGQPIKTVIPELFNIHYDGELQRLQETGDNRISGKAIEMHGITKKGVDVPVEISLTVQKIEKGKSLFTTIIRDLTERKKMEDALLQSEKLKSIGIITTGVSHEFNNILNIISGNVQLLMQRYKNHGKLIEALHTIKLAIDDGAEISNNMLRFTRTQQDTTEFEPLNISEIIKQSIDFIMPRWKNMAQAKGISYYMDIDGVQKTLAVYGNPTEIRKVFINIINNSLDAMPDGGCITFNTWSKEDKLFVSIADTGEGMSEDTRKHIFDPFFTTKTAVGTGLGMSTSYGIITRHGGKINIESEVGKGSTFTLQFPTTTKNVSPVESQELELGTKSKSIRILVIDDEENTRNLLNIYLSEVGHKVQTVDNGAEAIELAKREEYDLVLCDMVMPDIYGYDVVKALNALDKKPKIGIITGWTETQKPATFGELNVDFIMQKPFELSELTKHINEVTSVA